MNEVKYKAAWLSAIMAATFSLNAQALGEAASHKDGFSHLINDPKILNPEELSQVKPLPKTVALYFDGDRLHRDVDKEITEFVADQLTMRLVSDGTFEVAECSECDKTRVYVLKDAMRVKAPATTTEEFADLGDKVGADGFIKWDAKETDGRFNLAMRLVDSKKGNVLWSKEYTKEISQSDVERGYTEVDWRLAVSALGLVSTREATQGGTDATLSGVTAIKLNRKITPFDNEGVGYSAGITYFKNTSGQDTFDVSGTILGGRVYVDMGRMFNRIPYSLYGGVGAAIYNESRGFTFEGGFEFPFADYGYIAVGFLNLSGDSITWDSKPGFTNTSEFGGTTYDFTVGFNF